MAEVRARGLEGSVRVQARQISLVRLLLVAMGFGVLAIIISGRQPALVEPAASHLRFLLVTVSAIALALLATVWLARWRWQLALHLVFDLAWTGLLLHYSGGVSSPGVVLLFIIVVVGALVLPGVAPFVRPALASLALAVSATLYLAGSVPFPEAYLALNPSLTNTNRIVGMLATQVAALFVVDALGQLLSRRLHEQRIFTGELLDQLGEGVLAVDRTGAVAYANAEALRLLGLQGQVEGVLAADLLAARERAPVLALLSGASCPALERFVSPEGRQLVLRVTELIDRRERSIGRTLVIADETRLKLLEDSARRSEHLSALGEMAAGIAHEVRNPLTSLRGCAQELAELCSEAGQRDSADLARIMVGESDRLARIVEDFLVMSRLRQPVRGAVELPPMLRELEELVSRREDLPSGLHLEFRIDEATPPALADADQLRQVLTNLLNNSLDALRTVSLPRLSCRVRSAGASSPLTIDAIEIAVSDNGSGIPPELHERVFTPFFSTKSQGTGLGLALVQRIVREHEGALHLDSAPDRGTTITVYLPSHSQTRVFKRALGG